MTLISKNVYIDKLDDKVNEYNSAYRKTIKMKPVDVNQEQRLSLIKKIMRKILNIKLVFMLAYQNIKTFSQKATFRIVYKKFLWTKIVKKLCRGYV